MDENTTPPTMETPAEPPMSLTGRLLNVFATPGEVFEEVKAQPSTSANWLVPMVLACVIGILTVVFMFSQPTVLHQIQEQQEKQFDAQATRQKMSQKQADEMKATMERFMGPGVMIASGSAGVVFTVPARLFLSGLVVWLFGTLLFKAQFEYLKAVEAAGLASMVTILGSIVSTLLIVAKGNIMMRLSPILFVSQYDPSNITHALLSLLDVMTLWYLAVISIALQKLAGTTFVKAAACIYGLWAVVAGSMVALGVLMQHMLKSIMQH